MTKGKRFNGFVKILAAAAAVAMTVASSHLARAADTDGLTMDEEVKMVPTKGGQTTDIKMHVEAKGDSSRMTMTSGSTSTIIVKPADGKSYMLVPQRNMYMEMPAAATGAAAAPATSQPDADVKVTDTGKSQKIDGHDAEGWLVVVTEKQPNATPQQMTFWMAKDIADADKINQLMDKAPLSPMGGRGSTSGGSNVSVRGMPASAGVPMRMETAETDSTMTVDFTNIKFGPVPDADLQVPAGWTDLNAMFPAGMPAMPNGG